MNSTLKIVVPLVLVVLVVFGATLISLYTPPAETKSAPDDPAQVAGPPLLFTTTKLAYDPAAEDLTSRLFQGYYEKSETPVLASFWFQNPHPVPVKMHVTRRSCTSCTAARVAVVPPEALKAFFAQSAAGMFPPTPFPTPDLLTPLAGAALDRSLAWRELDFDHPEQGAEIPPAADAARSTWGVFQMLIKVSSENSKTLHAGVAVVAGTGPPAELHFSVVLVGVHPFALTPAAVKLGELAEGSGPRTVDVFYWSATRSVADLPKPVASVVPADGFVVVGEPIPLGPDGLARLQALLAADGQVVRVAGGYRVPVTVLRQRPAGPNGPAAEPDVGPFERRIDFLGPNSTTQSVTLTGTVTGLVGLTSGTAIDLKDFDGRFGTTKSVTLVSDRADLRLELAPNEQKPGYLKLALSDAEPSGGRTFWTLKVTVPEGACLDEIPADSSVVLVGKTATGSQKVRLTVKGRGFTRGR